MSLLTQRPTILSTILPPPSSPSPAGTRADLRQASTSQPTGQSQLSSSVEIGEDNPFTPQNTKKRADKNVSVNLDVTPGDSPVKATLKANTQAVMNTSGHSLYGDDIKLPSPDSPLR